MLEKCVQVEGQQSCVMCHCRRMEAVEAECIVCFVVAGAAPILLWNICCPCTCMFPPLHSLIGPDGHMFAPLCCCYLLCIVPYCQMREEAQRSEEGVIPVYIHVRTALTCTAILKYLQHN